MSSQEESLNDDLWDLDYEIRKAQYPGIEVHLETSLCKGDGSYPSPYEFSWPFPQEVIVTPQQVGALAQAIAEVIKDSNYFYYLRANGIIFVVNLDQVVQTGKALEVYNAFDSIKEMHDFSDETTMVLREVVRQYQEARDLPPTDSDSFD